MSPKIVIFQRSLSVVSLPIFKLLVLFYQISSRERPFEVKSDAHVKFLENVVHYYQIATNVLAFRILPLHLVQAKKARDQAIRMLSDVFEIRFQNGEKLVKFSLWQRFDHILLIFGVVKERAALAR